MNCTILPFNHLKVWDEILLNSIWGGGQDRPCLCFYLIVGRNLFYFELKLYVFVMTKAVSNRHICFIKAVLLLCKHGYFF